MDQPSGYRRPICVGWAVGESIRARTGRVEVRGGVQVLVRRSRRCLIYEQRLFYATVLGRAEVRRGALCVDQGRLGGAG